MDAVTSLIALFSISGTWFMTGYKFEWLDDAGGLIVSVMILRAGWDIVESSWKPI